MAEWTEEGKRQQTQTDQRLESGDRTQPVSSLKVIFVKGESTH